MPRRFRTARPPDPVHVILHLRRKIQVHHMRNPIHINPPRRNVRRHQHPHRPILEIR
jgi:hypothetical protein